MQRPKRATGLSARLESSAIRGAGFWQIQMAAMCTCNQRLMAALTQADFPPVPGGQTLWRSGAPSSLPLSPLEESVKTN